MKDLVKPFVLVAIMITLLIFASCGKDDGPDIIMDEVAEKPMEDAKEEAQDPAEEEEQPTEASNMIADNVVIKGGTKIDGAPPASNGAITMNLSNAGTSAVVDEGFNIPVISEADVIGAYIQFKAIDGGLSDSYYDVDILANQEESDINGKTPKFKTSKRKKAGGLTYKTTDGELDIDFGADIGPGEFCYVICVYDAAGNISEPQEVCVTVNAFGGNETLVGTWNLVRYEDTVDGITETELIGEEYCDDFGCETQEYDNITFNADGTWQSEARYNQRDLNGEYGSEYDEYLLRGKWSFPDTTDSDLVLVEYFYSETDQDGTEEETYAVGEAYVEVITAEEIEVTATELLITDRYDDDGDGNFEEVYITVYEKQ